MTGLAKTGTLRPPLTVAPKNRNKKKTKARRRGSAHVLHRANNRATRDAWQRFAPHRKKLTDALLALAPAGGEGSIALLGAGNGNDVDLDALATRYAEIRLLDVDEQAMAFAMERLSPEHAARVSAKKLTPWSHEDKSAKARPADVAVSLNVLSQLVWAAWEHGAAARSETAQRAVDAHLAQWLAHLEPGGHGFIVVDALVVDPAAERFDAATLSRMLVEAEGHDKTIPYCGVAHVSKFLQDAGRNPELLDPWVWAVNEERSFLTYALVL